MRLAPDIKMRNFKRIHYFAEKVTFFGFVCCPLLLLSQEARDWLWIPPSFLFSHSSPPRCLSRSLSLSHMLRVSYLRSSWKLRLDGVKVSRAAAAKKLGWFFTFQKICCEPVFFTFFCLRFEKSLWANNAMNHAFWFVVFISQVSPVWFTFPVAN